MLSKVTAACHIVKFVFSLIFIAYNQNTFQKYFTTTIDPLANEN